MPIQQLHHVGLESVPSEMNLEFPTFHQHHLIIGLPTHFQGTEQHFEDLEISDTRWPSLESILLVMTTA